jgi:metal-responsive CopG/Arc/MetJ family transcriptional regulator
MTAVILPAMKTAVSIPDRVFQSAEKLAARLGVSRSELYARALASLVEQHREDIVTSKLNEIYADDGEDSSLEKELSVLQARSISREKW